MKWTSTFWQTALLAGTLDITAACIQTLVMGGKLERLMKFIASGVFGNAAFEGGVGMVAAGLLFHYCIATTWVALYFFLYPKLEFLRINLALSAVIWGAIVWACMNLIVLPMSNTPAIPFRLERAALAMFILIICIGLPAAWGARR